MALKKGTKLKDEVKWSQQYAVTITLNPTLFNLATQFQRNEIQGALNTIVENKCAQFSLICEMTRSFNVHLHGVMRVPITKSKKSMLHQCQEVFRNVKDAGYVCIKPITEYKHWIFYCIKDYDKTFNELEGQSPVVINNMGDFTDIPTLLDDLRIYQDQHLPMDDSDY